MINAADVRRLASEANEELGRKAERTAVEEYERIMGLILMAAQEGKDRVNIGRKYFVTGVSNLLDNRGFNVLKGAVT